MILYLINFCLFFFFFNPSISSEICLNSICNQDDLVIRFPFRIETNPKFCGYPGFDLSCNSAGQTVIDLPPSGKFIVQHIDYQNQEIWINDPNNCLPRKILSLNLSNSPFVGNYNQDFTFFNCSSLDYLSHGLNPIACLSDSINTVFASSSPTIISNLSASCRRMKTVSVPVLRSFYEAVPSTDLSDDLWLRWRMPGCGRCELLGGLCGFRNNSSHAILCTNIPQREGIPRGARYAVTIGVGVPAVICLLGLTCCFLAKIKSFSGRRNSGVEAHWIVSSQPTNIMGLDGPTIDSYPKIVLGQSLRIPMPNDNTCPICLSEYRPKETLKSIPECQHCFHQHCIDEWLRLNASCPVCRNAPMIKPSG